MWLQKNKFQLVCMVLLVLEGVIILGRDGIRTNLKNNKAAGKNDVTGEMIKCSQQQIGYENCVIWLWKTAMVIQFYKGKGERTEWKNYRLMNVVSGVGKFFAEVLVDSSQRD